MLRVRFAPSPTGYLHVGGLRSALYNYLLAKRHGGKFLLRIEDTDQGRLVIDAVQNIVDNLRWAGIPPDEGVGCDPEGPHGPYTQSQRLDKYRAYADQLLEKDLAYRCFATAEELAKMREEHGGYDRRYRDCDRADSERRAQAGEPHVIRMKVPDGEVIEIDDLIRGKVSFQSAQVDDQVLLKSDGFPTYHLAAVVDDHEMEITHVIRGEEWLSSTPKHVLLYRFFGWEAPRFAHLPLIVNLQGKKLSKRDGDVSVDPYRQAGYLPQALLNFLALLGWSAGDDREIYTREELVQAFSLERVNHSPSVFDLDKLRYINQQHLMRMEDRPLAEEVIKWFPDDGDKPSLEYLTEVVRLMKPRCHLLSEFVDGCRYFYQDPDSFEEATFKKRWKEDSARLLDAYRARLEKLGNWKAPDLEAALRELCEAEGVGAGQLIHPTRLAVSGVGGGPGLFEMMEVLGRDTVLRRLARVPQLIG